MKFSESWLREWVDPQCTREELSDRLTMTGLEVDGLHPLSTSSTPSTHIDYVMEIAITPNRGDCLSIQGMAREVSAITQTPLKKINRPVVKPYIRDTLAVTIKEKQACPRYAGRIIRGIKADVMTPVWMEERLKHSDIRLNNFIVDVTNYVMLELGQPMHAFNLAQIEKEIKVRMALKNEALVLLDGREVQLNENTLIIADQNKPLAIAGVMGGLNSAITLQTRDIFLESAFFTPSMVARQRQYYQLNSDSAYRFERGVDPELQRIAMERATQLILDIAGGEPGPVTEVKSKRANITLILRYYYLTSIVGCKDMTETEVKNILQSLGFIVKKGKKQWQVKVPSYRFDITQEIDLVEEIARLYGFENIPSTRPVFSLQAHERADHHVALPIVRRLLCDKGYHEVVTYSFVDQQRQALLDPERRPKALVNPITADMTVMRTNLWPGLIGAYLHNRDRQQNRQRLFETGLCFIEQPMDKSSLSQVSMLGGLVSGSVFPEQWGLPFRNIDFFDVKGDIESLLQLTHSPCGEFSFKPMTHPALHPGQSAFLYRQAELIGVLGAVHPAVRQELGILEPIFLFEFFLDTLLAARSLAFNEISRFPEIRRDIALLVDRHVSSDEIQYIIIKNGSEWLRQVTLFDIYSGEGIPKNKKSMAYALTLQHASRTLQDEEVAETVNRILQVLKQTLGIELRG